MTNLYDSENQSIVVLILDLLGNESRLSSTESCPVAAKQKNEEKKAVFLWKKCKKMTNLEKNEKNDVFTSSFVNEKHWKVGGWTKQ